MVVIGCSERVPYDNSKKMEELDKNLKNAKDETKKAEESMNKAAKKLKDIQDKEATATGDEKDKLQKAAQELNKKFAEAVKALKESSISSILSLLNIIDQSAQDKRKDAYQSIASHEYNGDILKSYFDGGSKPIHNDFAPLEQDELNKVLKDLTSVARALH